MSAMLDVHIVRKAVRSAAGLRTVIEGLRFQLRDGEIVALAGGGTGTTKAAFVGGPGGGALRADQLDTPYDFEPLHAAGAGIGATLLLMVLVSQSVLLLPLPAAAVVTALIPLVHVGMTWGDGLRNGLGVFAAAAFTAVVTELLRRAQQARAELAEANVALRGYAAQAEELATTQERNRLARDIHDGIAQELAALGYQVDALRAKAGPPGNSLRDGLDTLRGGLSEAMADLPAAAEAWRRAVRIYHDLGDPAADEAGRRLARVVAA